MWKGPASPSTEVNAAPARSDRPTSQPRTTRLTDQPATASSLEMRMPPLAKLSIDQAPPTGKHFATIAVDEQRVADPARLRVSRERTRVSRSAALHGTSAALRASARPNRPAHRRAHSPRVSPPHIGTTQMNFGERRIRKPVTAAGDDALDQHLLRGARAVTPGPRSLPGLQTLVDERKMPARKWEDAFVDPEALRVVDAIHRIRARRSARWEAVTSERAHSNVGSSSAASARPNVGICAPSVATAQPMHCAAMPSVELSARRTTAVHRVRSGKAPKADRNLLPAPEAGSWGIAIRRMRDTVMPN